MTWTCGHLTSPGGFILLIICYYLFVGAQDSGGYEQSLTIVSTSGRPRSSRDRRASLADYAFPELHEKVISTSKP